MEHNELKALIRDLHAIPGCETGGPLHIVTDDPNYEDSHLDFCMAEVLKGFSPDGWWLEYQDPEDTVEMIRLGMKILWELRSLSVEDREKVCTYW